MSDVSTSGLSTGPVARMCRARDPDRSGRPSHDSNMERGSRSAVPASDSNPCGLTEPVKAAAASGPLRDSLSTNTVPLTNREFAWMVPIGWSAKATSAAVTLAVPVTPVRKSVRDRLALSVPVAGRGMPRTTVINSRPTSNIGRKGAFSMMEMSVPSCDSAMSAANCTGSAWANCAIAVRLAPGAVSVTFSIRSSDL